MKLYTKQETCGKDVNQLEVSDITGGNVKWYDDSGRLQRFLTESNINLPFYSSIPHINMHLSQKKCKTHPHTHTNTCMSMAAFTVDNSWKQSKCPWRSEWMNKLLFHFSATLLNNPSERTTSTGIAMPNKSQTHGVNTAWCHMFQWSPSWPEVKMEPQQCCLQNVERPTVQAPEQVFWESGNTRYCDWLGGFTSASIC